MNLSTIVVFSEMLIERIASSLLCFAVLSGGNFSLLILKILLENYTSKFAKLFQELRHRRSGSCPAAGAFLMTSARRPHLSAERSNGLTLDSKLTRSVTAALGDALVIPLRCC